MKNYTFKFDIWALSLFVAVMLPNIIWFAVPAKNEVLRVESVTPVIDVLASIFQVLMIAALVLLGRKEMSKVRWRDSWSIVTITMVALYYSFWGLYYSGCVPKAVILSICIIPCLAFISYSINRKNIPALVFGIIFMVLHFVFAVMNY